MQNKSHLERLLSAVYLFTNSDHLHTCTEETYNKVWLPKLKESCKELGVEYNDFVDIISNLYQKDKEIKAAIKNA